MKLDKPPKMVNWKVLFLLFWPMVYNNNKRNVHTSFRWPRRRPVFGGADILNTVGFSSTSSGTSLALTGLTSLTAQTRSSNHILFHLIIAYLKPNEIF